MHFRGRSKSGHADSEIGGHAHSEMTGHLPEMGGHDGLKYALDCLNRLGRDVQIVVRKRSRSQVGGHTSVVFA